MSAGIRANTAIGEAIGLKTGGGIRVNARMETGIAGIYACGDCAEYQEVNYGVWQQAVEQGKTAGANAAGDSREYVPQAQTFTFHGMNTSLFAAGDNGKNPRLLYKTMELQDMGKEQYRKYYFLNNRLCGVILLGDVSDMAKMIGLLEKHASYQEVTSSAIQ